MFSYLAESRLGKENAESFWLLSFSPHSPWTPGVSALGWSPVTDIGETGIHLKT